MSFTRSLAPILFVAFMSATVRAGLFDNSVLTMLPVAAHDVVYDSTRNLLYASVPANAGAPNANSIVTIDPFSRTVIRSVFVGSDPNRLAISSDGSRVYVGLDGNHAFTWWQPADNIIGPAVSLTSGTGIIRPDIVENFAVSPLSSDVVVVSKDEVGTSASGALELFRNGISIGHATPNYPNNDANEIGFLDNHTLFSFDNKDTSLALATWNFDGTSLSQKSKFSSVFESFSTHTKVRGGLVYESTGKVLDPVTMTYLGFFHGAFSAAVESDPSLGRTYFAGHSSTEFTIQAYDSHSFLALESKNFPAVLSGSFSQFVLAGPNTWAFVTSSGQFGLVSNIPEPNTTVLLLVGMLGCSFRVCRNH